MCIDTHLNTKILVKQSENHGGKMSYILGIDQGGTKTAAAVMDEAGKILGIATRRGAYYPTDGMTSAFTKIKEAVEEAIAQAGITREQIGTAIAGITGIDWQGDKEKVSNELKKYLKFLICMPIIMQLLLYTVWRKAKETWCYVPEPE